MIIPEFAPSPYPGSQGDRPVQLLMQFDKVIIELIIAVIVVPIHQLNAFWNFSAHFGRDIGVQIIIILRRVAQPEIHIRPDHRVQPAFGAHFIYSVQMAVEQFKPVDIAVTVKEIAASQVVGFIHANMYTAAAERLAPEIEHFSISL